MPGICHSIAGSLACVVAFVTSIASAQSTAQLGENPGATLSVTATVIGNAQGVPFNETDTASADVTGELTLSLFPADPPFGEATLQAMQVSTTPLVFDFCLLELFGSCLGGAQVTVTDLNVALTSASSSSLDGAGDAVFTDAELDITGLATVTGAGALAGQLNETLPIDVTTNATQMAQITEATGAVTFTGFVFPQVSETVAPEDLPSGITALTINLSTNASAVSFSGPYGPALLGDFNADGVIDATDHAGLVSCLGGPAAPVAVPCPLVDLDSDGDVDLVDYAALVAAP